MNHLVRKILYVFVNFLIIIFLIFYFNLTSAQNKQKADSFINVLDNKKIDIPNKIRIYLKIAEYETPRKGLEYANKAFELSKEFGDKYLIAKSLEEIGIRHRTVGNSVASYNAFLQALRIYEELNLIKPQAIINSQLGVLHIDNKNFKEGIKFLTKSLLFYEELKNSFNIAALNINLGEAYRLIAKYDSAEVCFKKCLQVNRELNNDLIFAYAIGNLGMVHANKGKLKLAKSELKQAIPILEHLGDPYSVAVYKSELGNILINEGKDKQGEKLLIESLNIAQKEGLKEQISDISKKLAVYYESIGLYKNALMYRKDYESFKDSIINYENVRKIEQLRGEYEMEKKETEINFLNKTNRIQKKFNLGLGLGALLFILLAFFLFRLYKKTRKANFLLEEQKEIIQKREDEKAILLKELNHRVKNNLQMISSLLNLQSNRVKGHPAAESLKAGKYRVEALSLVHQKLYQEDYHTKIALNEYIEELALNLVHCFDKNVKLNLELENIEVDIDTVIPLGLVVNELITNSLKHAFDNITNPLLTVAVKKKNGQVFLTIRDNGKGFTDNESQNTSGSFGLRLVNSLLKQLNGQLICKNQDGCEWEISIVN